MVRLVSCVLVVAAALLGWIGGRPRAPLPSALPLSATGVEGTGTLRDRFGRILAVNVRAVEPGRLYRASSFPVNAQMTGPSGVMPYPAALVGRAWFEFLQARHIREVVTLDAADESFFAEDGYYRYWGERTRYSVVLRRVPVPAEDAYSRNEKSGIHAGAELIHILKHRRPEEGALLVHGDTGKDGVGVAVATYEAWRDRGWVDAASLWNAITARYLLSNQLLREAGPFAGSPARCPSGSDGYVCADWLGSLRNDVEFVAKL